MPILKINLICSKKNEFTSLFFEVYKNFTLQKTNDQNVTALKVILIYEI